MGQARAVIVQDVISAWIFWLEAIDRPDAGALVTGIDRARVALHGIQEHGFLQDEMEQWLKEWPTPYGLVQYRRVCE